MQTISLIGSFLRIVFLFAVLLVLLFLFYHYLISILRAFSKFYAPFVPVSRRVIPAVVEAFTLAGQAIDNQSIVYDLGCGDGRILKEAYREKPEATYVGLELDALPYLLARINTKNIRSSRFKILKKNLFSHDLKEATHLVVYLFPKVMDALLPKLEQELPPGAVLVSVSFTFSKKEPEKIIDLKRSPRALVQRLYVYRF